MLCEETKQSLSLYIDDCVSLPTRVAIDEHLDRCPVCRDEVAQLRSLRRRLSSLSRPTPPPDLASTITDALIIESAARRQAPNPSWTYRIARFLQPRVMPYTVGSFASVILFALMFAALRPHFVALRGCTTAGNVLRLPYRLRSNKPTPETLPQVSSVREQSPSLNPALSLR